MDDTLINGPNSELFQQFVRDNPDIEHHIVTFRNKDWADKIYHELERVGLKQHHFKSLTHIPDYIYHAFYSTKDEPYYVEIREWKGYIASINQCTLLVDDLRDMVIDGCIKYNVEFLDAYTTF